MNYKQIKYYPILIGTLLFGLSLKAQTNEGTEAIYSGMFQTAKSIFQKQLADSMVKPEACYYLGEIYRLTGHRDSAAYYYELGVAVEKPNPLCLVGKAGLLMFSNSAVSAGLIEKAEWVKEYSKNPELYVAIAKVYADNKKFTRAYEMLELAKDINKEYTNTYLTEGDILLQQNKPGDAAAKYEAAAHFNPKCKPAYLKLALIYYKIRNYELALKYLDKIYAIDNHFAPALKLFGDISYEQGKYSEAVTTYTEFLNSPEASISDKIRLAYSLFFNKQYQQSLDMIIQLTPSFPNNQVLKRLWAYSLFEIGKYAEGLSRMQEFLNSVEPSTIIASDYKYYARLLSKNEQDSLSIVYYQKAIVTSNSPLEFYKEMAFVYEKMKKFDMAATYLEKYVKNAKTPTISDFYNWGRDCYFAAGNIDSLSMVKDSSLVDSRNKFYLKADSVFSQLIILSPENHLGYLWRARVNAIFDSDSENGLAKPFYEKVAALLELPNVVNIKELVESYQYLGYYYFIKEDLKQSKIYWNKILSLDPDNEIAIKAIEGIK